MKLKIDFYRIFPVAVLLSLFIFTSCVKDPEYPQNDQDTHVKIILNGDHDTVLTKTTLSGNTTLWVAGSDKCGVYCPQAGGTEGNVNVPYTALTSAKQSDFTGSMTWGIGTHYFYAYYPYSAGSSAATAVPITLSSTQTQSAGNNSSHIGALDFMVATPTSAVSGTSGEPTSVNLVYNHVFSILEFQIKRSSGSGDIQEIKLSGNGPLAFAGTIDITQSTPASSAGYTINRTTLYGDITLTLTTAVTPTSDYSTTPKIYMVVWPESIDNYLTIAIKSGGTYKFFQKATPSGGFKRGKKYVVQLDAANATEYPGTTLSSITLGGATWAPVNCGYVQGVHPYGLLYQFNRKYGQCFDGETPSVTLTAGPVTLATGNLTSNCNVFYTIASGTEWATDPGTSGWDLTNNNPCPVGWAPPAQAHVAAVLALAHEEVASGGSGIDQLPGEYLGTSPTRVFFPYGGQREADGAILTTSTGVSSRGLHSDVWTREYKAADASYCFDLYKTSSGLPKDNDRAEWDPRELGLGVRCVKL